MAHWFTTQDPKVLEYEEHGVWVGERFKHSGDALRRNDEVAVYEVSHGKDPRNKALGAQAVVAILRVTRRIDPPEGPDEYGFLQIAEAKLIASDETGIPSKQTIKILKGINAEGRALGSHLRGFAARATMIGPDVFATISEHFTEYEPDLDYQTRVEKASPRPPSSDKKRPKYLERHGHRTLVTSPELAAYCIAAAGFSCQARVSHTTFTSKVSGNSYVEAHHFVPLRHQPFFEFTLDNAANILALCPNCHRLLHHATADEREELLRQLVTADRLENLAAWGIEVNADDILRYY